MSNQVIKEALQNGKKGTERVQRKVGKTHVDYWYSRLRKRKFKRTNGTEVEVPDWQIRLKHLGRFAWFNLKTANVAEAAVKARDIYIFLIANGWDATLAKFKPQAEPQSVDTIDDFVDLYRREIELTPYPPSKRTVERYIDALLYVCRIVRVRRLANLTDKKIKKFVAKYQKIGRKEGRDEDSVKTSCNTHLRNAASLFSPRLEAAYKAAGVAIVSPFKGQQLRRIEIQPYTPMPRELLDSIWKDSAKLRDGDPEAPEPGQRECVVDKPGGADEEHDLKKKRVRWKEPDWRLPQPEAFKILMLELGIGLRREESDKAPWDCFFVSSDGRRFFEVRKTEFFTPKGKRRRVLPVEEHLWEALCSIPRGPSPFVINGRAPKVYTRETMPKTTHYRCEKHHRILTLWLRKKGINDDKPCHRLRKEFGSYVATSFGLFAAQRLLGHSSPVVTDTYYAALVNLPELRHVHVPRSAA